MAKKKTKRLSLGYIFGGGILKEKYIRKRAGLLFLIFICTIILISNRYSCHIKIQRIDKLKRELRDTQTEALELSIDLARYSRLSTIEEMVKQQGLDLQAPIRPPYILHK
jgi:hypothetical protein